MKESRLNKQIKITLLGAIAFMLMYFDFPVLPIFPWLKIDLSDVPALMGAFAFGPMVGIIIELLKNIFIIVVKGTQTGFVGEFANFLVGISMVVPAAVIYNKNKTKKSAIIGMIVGAISIEVIGVLANVYILLPAYGMKMTAQALIQYITLGLLPFNGIKALMISIITFVLYKRVSTAIFKVEPMKVKSVK